MALLQDITFFSGDTAPIDGALSNINLTGATVRFYIRSDVNSTENIFVKSSANGEITITDAAAGKFSLTLTSTETATLKGVYYFEVEVVDSLGNVTTVTTGSLTSEVGRVGLSYATVDYADSYFGDVLYSDPWGATSADDKAKALRMATKKIDSIPVKGVKAVQDQPLEFPRLGEAEVQPCVKEATCEEALSILRGGRQAAQRSELQRQGVTSFSLGPLSESYSGGYTSSKLTSLAAAQLLSRYTGGSWSIV